MTSRRHLAALSDDQLLARVNDLVGRGQHILTDLLVHLGEVEARQLHLAQAFPTMHAQHGGDVAGYTSGLSYRVPAP